MHDDIPAHSRTRSETEHREPARLETTGEITRALIVIVPAYNEAGRIGETVAALKSVRAELAQLGCDMRVYVIDDGSSDGTRLLAREAGADRVLRHKLNRGLGAAVRTGLAAARADGADIAVKFDADLQHDPRDIIELIRPIVEDEAEIVYGNRFDRIEYRMPLMRRAGNLVFTSLMRWLTGWPLKDSQPGVFAVDRSYLEQFNLPGDYNYTQQILLDAYHRHMRFEHVPVAFRKRITGKSFISLRYPFKVLPQIVMVIVGLKPMRIFGPVGLAFLGLAGLVAGIEIATYLGGGTAKPVQSVNLVLGSGIFGLQVFLFGLIAELIVHQNR